VRPIIFALSNPTEHHECLPELAYEWSGGKALYAGGVQFPPVHLGGQTFLPSQANNRYIFPAVGMAIYATNFSSLATTWSSERRRQPPSQSSSVVPSGARRRRTGSPCSASP